MAEEQRAIPGYVRCGVIHATDEWRLEVDDEAVRVGVLMVETADGALTFGMRRQSAQNLLRALRALSLFLEDRAEGQL
jgi:hypothetical protein